MSNKINSYKFSFSGGGMYQRKQFSSVQCSQVTLLHEKKLMFVLIDA
jgi:hypothetical protein